MKKTISFCIALAIHSFNHSSESNTQDKPTADIIIEQLSAAITEQNKKIANLEQIYQRGLKRFEGCEMTSSGKPINAEIVRSLNAYKDYILEGMASIESGGEGKTIMHIPTGHTREDKPKLVIEIISQIDFDKNKVKNKESQINKTLLKLYSCCTTVIIMGYFASRIQPYFKK
jgi:hypothetical protein